MYDTGSGLTVGELHEAVAGENGALGDPVPTPGQVYRALAGLARRRSPLVEQSGPGRGAWWRQTSHGRAMLAAWCGEDEPVRVPCGLGWPGPAVMPRPGRSSR